MRVVITGASKGIGEAIALELAPASEVMFLLARSGELLNQVAGKVQAVNSECTVIAKEFDVTHEASIDQLASAISDSYEGLDVLVNCAGYAIPATAVQETSLDEWNTIFSVNVTAPYLMTKRFISLLRQSSNASIINIASTAGTSPRPGWSAYAASKAALVNFSNTMAEELKPDGIHVHCVAPGRTATELRRVLAPDEDPSTIMQPEAVARIVSYLVGENGNFLKGQTILVRGD